MIYVTGDMHGDESRFYDREWRKLKSGDTLIVCGDFGYLWNGGEREKSVVKYLGTRKFTTCFLDGTHENFDMIDKCRETIWRGGRVHRINGKLFHLMRGQIYTIEGIRIFTFGGGESEDKDIRSEDGKWWREELPTPAQIAEAAQNLDEVNLEVDYILTHEPPSLVKSAMLLRAGRADRVNKLNGFFEEIDRSCKYRHWYFGSLHEDKLVTPNHTCLFKKIILLGSKEQISKN
ncbi:MAG: metallophosphoesterase [Oscillospiraceae bacterium]|nr:metallophosphoesterase [Oscillospiraceae bacterium]